MVNRMKSRLKRKDKDSKRAKSYEGSSSKGRLEIKDMPRFKKMFSNQVPSKFPMTRDDSVSNLNS